MDIDELIDVVIMREGGFSNHPADRGGATRWGITEAVARAHGYHGRMDALPVQLARDIYRNQYWLTPRLNRIARHNMLIAAEMFDTAVNMGPGVAVRMLQRALNALNRRARDYPDIDVDGLIGPATEAALGGFLTVRGKTGQTVLLKALEALQGERYIALAEQRPANEAFLYGWLANRIGS